MALHTPLASEGATPRSRLTCDHCGRHETRINLHSLNTAAAAQKALAAGWTRFAGQLSFDGTLNDTYACPTCGPLPLSGAANRR